MPNKTSTIYRVDIEVIDGEDTKDVHELLCTGILEQSVRALNALANYVTDIKIVSSRPGCTFDEEGEIVRKGESSEERNLYLVIVNESAHYFVYTDYMSVMNERSALLETGQENKVVFVKLSLSDFDEINHNHFC